MYDTPKILTTLLLCLALASAQSKLAGYFGQDYQGNEQSLASYCSTYDIINLAFLDGFGLGTTDFNIDQGCTNPNANNGCSQLAGDVTSCQQQGKKIMLSLGGAYGNYGFNSAAQAQQVALLVWNMFLGGSSSNRPFGNVKLDGVDLDFERDFSGRGYVRGDPQYVVDFVTALRGYFSQDTSKTYYISAAPQCPFPDYDNGPAIASTSTQIDYIQIQFYNNPDCNIGGADFQARLQDYVTLAQSRGFKIFIGVPSSPSKAGNGYVSLSTLEQTYTAAVNQYGSVIAGVMLYDVAGDQSYASAINQYIKNGATPTTSSSTRSSTSTSSSTTTSSPTTSSMSTSSSSASNPCFQSGTPSTGYCPTSGYMQCVGSSYQTCSNNQWSAIQSCGQGTACSQSGNYIYCLSCSGSSTTSPPTTSPSSTVASSASSTVASSTSSSGGVCNPDGSTDGNMECTGYSTYHTCDHGAWSVDQSCSTGLKCSSSGTVVYCIRP